MWPVGDNHGWIMLGQVTSTKSTSAGAEGMAGKKDHLALSTSYGIQGPEAAAEPLWGETGNGSM